MKNKNKWIVELLDQATMKMSAILWFAFSAILIWILLQLLNIFYGFSLLNWLKSLPILYPFFQYIYGEILKGTPLGIIYLFSIASFFLFPVPLEALFFTYIREFYNHTYFIIFSIIGLFIGQLINYLLGRNLGFIFRHFFNKKTKRNFKNKINKYGGGAIILMEAVPLPFQLFNFFTGIFKYQFKKFIFFSMTGLIIKNIILYLIYIYFF